jgi:transcriptional regulator with XRE-family HTH domain
MGKTRRRRFKPAQVAKRIHEARLGAGLSQAEASEKAGFMQTRWSHWECGKALPRAGALFGLAQALGVSADWLLGLED